MAINSLYSTTYLPIISDVTSSYPEEINGEMSNFFDEPHYPPLSESSFTAFPELISLPTLPTLDTSSSSILYPEPASHTAPRQVVQLSYPSSNSSILSSTASCISSSSQVQKQIQGKETHFPMNGSSSSSSSSSSSGSSVPIQCRHPNTLCTCPKQQGVIPTFNELMSRGRGVASHSVSSQSSSSLSSGVIGKKRKTIEGQEKPNSDSTFIPLTERIGESPKEASMRCLKAMGIRLREVRGNVEQMDVAIKNLKQQRSVKCREYDMLTNTAADLMSKMGLPHPDPTPLLTPDECFIQNFEFQLLTMQRMVNSFKQTVTPQNSLSVQTPCLDKAKGLF